jgi:hypothetical protein
VRVDLWTHAAGGLTENDFVMAARSIRCTTGVIGMTAACSLVSMHDEGNAPIRWPPVRPTRLTRRDSKVERSSRDLWRAALGIGRRSPTTSAGYGRVLMCISPSTLLEPVPKNT